MHSGFDDRLEDEDYALIAENTGIQLKRKKFRRVHGNVLDSDEEDETAESRPEEVTSIRGNLSKDDSLDSASHDEDFTHVSS